MAAGDKGRLTDPVVANESAGAKCIGRKASAGQRVSESAHCIRQVCRGTRHQTECIPTQRVLDVPTPHSSQPWISRHYSRAPTEPASHAHPAARIDVQRRPRVAPVQHRARQRPLLSTEPDNTTYWQVARAVVAAEPTATDAAATNAMVMGEAGDGDGRRGNGMRVVVGDTDDREAGGRGSHTAERVRVATETGGARRRTRIRPALLCLAKQKNRGCAGPAQTPAARRGDLAQDAAQLGLQTTQSPPAPRGPLTSAADVRPPGRALSGQAGRPQDHTNSSRSLRRHARIAPTVVLFSTTDALTKTLCGVQHAIFLSSIAQPSQSHSCRGAYNV